MFASMAPESVSQDLLRLDEAHCRADDDLA